MRFDRYLQEEYLMNIQGNWGGLYNGISDIFENPTTKELKSLTSTVRFIVNFASKKLYVWNWNVTHTDVAGYLIKDKLIPSNVIDSSRFLKTCFAGIGEVKGGKIKYTRASDCIWSYDSCEWLKKKYDDEWTKLYFGDSLISILKQSWGLKEEYQSMIRQFPIFVNPTPKEVKEISDSYVRCIIDFEKKNLYVFFYGIIHDEVMKKLEKEIGLHSWRDWHDTKSDANQYYSFCTAKVLSNGKLKFYRSDVGVYWNNIGMLDFKWMKMSDDWLKPWFGSNYIKDFIAGCKDPKDFV